MPTSLFAPGRKALFGIALVEAHLDKRGFAATTSEKQKCLEDAGESFIQGYLIALSSAQVEHTAAECELLAPAQRGFAYEGSAMGLALLDLLSLGRPRLFRAFLEGPAQQHIYMAHVGAGWALARCPWGMLTFFPALDPLLKWLAIDGLGFHEGYFKPSKFITARGTSRKRQRNPEAFDNGLGRAIWFAAGARAEHVTKTLAAFPTGTPEMGTEALFRALETNIPASSAVITSRIPSVPTLKISRSDFKPYRFLERTLVDYPQIELIAEADLATQKDLYLNDHKLDGTPLFPAALGLEAMVEAATALLGKAPTTLSDVRFASPITVEEGIGTTIRVATLRRSYSVTDVTIRSSQTGFQVVHFRATCSIDPVGEPDVAGAAPPAGDLLRCEELYDSILFQRGRFRSVGGYFEARARSSCALLSPTEQPWFSQFLPQSLLLISPAIMDASMHSIQACIPHKRLIPTAIEQITIYQDSIPAQFFICKARERSGSGDDFHYDLEIADQYGNALQVWKGLTLHAIAVNDTALLRTPQLIANVLERRWREIADDDSVAICLLEEPSGICSFRDGRSKRADGKPTLAGPVEARAWSDKVLLQVRSLQQGSCDLERVAYRDPQVWRGLLGESLFQTAVFLANERGEEFDLAATRVWGIAECLKKLGNGTAGAVTFETYTADGWAIVRCGDYLVGTVPITVSQSQTVAAFATRSTNTGIAPVEVRRAAVSL